MFGSRTARESSDGSDAQVGGPAVEVDGLCFGYGGSLVVDHVSFRVERGEAVALVGPNGCGKSTVLRLLNGLERPSSGTVRVLGQLVDGRTMRDKAVAKRLHQRAAYVFQNPDAMLFCPTVAEEVAFGPRQMGLGEDEVRRRVADALELFGVAHLSGRAPYHLSGGEKRRVAMAAVVSMNPELLMLDELTDGLDQASAARMFAFLRSYLEAGGTVLMTTHHDEAVEALGARRVRMGADHRLEEP